VGKQFHISALCVSCAITLSPIHAANFSYSGSFSADDDVQLFDFTVDVLSTVTIRTFGYAGGTQDDGNQVSAGGFDPMVTVFDGSGIHGGNIDGLSPAVLVDPDTGLALDALFTADFAAGSYTVALTQYGNFALGFTPDDGFSYQGVPDFTTFFEVAESCANGQFCSTDSAYRVVDRTDRWALDILNVASASVVPVPAAVWLFGSGLLGLVVLARRNRAWHSGDSVLVSLTLTGNWRGLQCIRRLGVRPYWQETRVLSPDQ
jgi:hypothetical protein